MNSTRPKLELLTAKEQRKVKRGIARQAKNLVKATAAHEIVTRNWRWIEDMNATAAVRAHDWAELRTLMKEKEISVEEWLDYYAEWRRDRGVLLVRCAQFGE